MLLPSEKEHISFVFSCWLKLLYLTVIIFYIFFNERWNTKSESTTVKVIYLKANISHAGVAVPNYKHLTHLWVGMWARQGGMVKHWGWVVLNCFQFNWVAFSFCALRFPWIGKSLGKFNRLQWQQCNCAAPAGGKAGLRLLLELLVLSCYGVSKGNCLFYIPAQIASSHPVCSCVYSSCSCLFDLKLFQHLTILDIIGNFIFRTATGINKLYC